MSSKTTNKSAQRKSISSKSASPPAKYPRNTVDKSLRIPKAILEQNAGKPCTVKESATFLGVGAAGPYQVEVSSGIKYGFLERPTPGQIAVTERAKHVLRPQDPQDRLDGLRDAVLSAPVISEVYGHYRGENLPDTQFFHNALVDTFSVPADKVGEFQEIFIESLKAANYLLNRTVKPGYWMCRADPKSLVLKPDFDRYVPMPISSEPEKSSIRSGLESILQKCLSRN